MWPSETGEPTRLSRERGMAEGQVAQLPSGDSITATTLCLDPVRFCIILGMVVQRFCAWSALGAIHASNSFRVS